MKGKQGVSGLAILFWMVCATVFPQQGRAGTFPRPSAQVALIGSVQTVKTYQNDSPATLGNVITLASMRLWQPIRVDRKKKPFCQWNRS